MTDETQEQRWERLSKDRVDRPLPKRFYKTVAVGDDLAILLDGRAVKTPMRKKLVLPTRNLAEAIAGEWEAVAKLINPANMPLTKLANTAIDTVASSRQHVVDEVVAYAGNDMVCYLAERPADHAHVLAIAPGPAAEHLHRRNLAERLRERPSERLNPRRSIGDGAQVRKPVEVLRLK